MKRMTRKTKMITTQELEFSGYKQFPANKVLWPYAEKFFQKLFSDSAGEKYFLNFVWYSKEAGYTHPECSFQFCLNKKEDAVFNGQFIHLEKIHLYQIEAKVEKLWRTLGKPYYNKTK